MDGGVVTVVTSRGQLSSCSLVVQAVPGLVVCGPGWVVAVGGPPCVGGCPCVGGVARSCALACGARPHWVGPVGWCARAATAGSMRVSRTDQGSGDDESRPLYGMGTATPIA